jgi:hypothetical protein
MRKKLFLLSTLLLSAVGFAQYSIINTTLTPLTAQVGGTVPLTFSYTAAAACSTQFQVVSSNDAHLFNGGSPVITTNFTGAFAAPLIVNPGTDVSGNVTITLSGDVGPTSSLPAGFKYYIFGKLGAKANGAPNDVYWDSASGYIELTVTPVLGVNSFNNLSTNEMYVNTTSKSLVVNTTAVTSNSAKIYDMTGKNVATLSNLKSAGSVDLSGLRNGVFVLVTDNNKKIKFAL